MKEIKERPILFSAPMVRAILAGQKTQTRRLVKLPQFRIEFNGCYDLPGGGFCGTGGGEPPEGATPKPWFVFDGTLDITTDGLILCRQNGWDPTRKILREMGQSARSSTRLGYALHAASEVARLCPYGAPGDRLWVRETWGLANACPGGDFFTKGDWLQLGYKADGHVTPPMNQPAAVVEKAYADVLAEMEKAGIDGSGIDARVCRWRSARYMPRRASRLLLEVVSVRVERLQEISGDDAAAEGAVAAFVEKVEKQEGVTVTKAPCSVECFRQFWNKINGKAAPWADNPWVWAVEFKKVQP